MINTMQKAIIQKDLRFVKTTKGNLSSIIVVSLMFGVIVPAIFIIGIHFTPDDAGEFAEIVNLLLASDATVDLQTALFMLALNYITPMFFMMIPVISAATMSASSFVGEKEKRTLETLCYSPLPIGKIFSAKVLASLFMAMAVTLATFILFVIISQTMLFFMLGHFIFPGLMWLVLILVVTPALSLLAITITSMISAKAQTIEEAVQKSGLLTIPIILIMSTQFTGIILINAWIMLGFGAVIAIIALVLLKNSLRNYNYEKLLK